MYSTLTTVRLVGSIVQWTSSLLLVGVFALLIPLHSQRRAVITWMVAFAAQAVLLSWPALTNLALLCAPTATRDGWMAILRPLAWPAQFVSLTAIALGALGATGRRIPARPHYQLLAAAAALGLLAVLSDAAALATKAYIVATVILVFAVAQAVLFRARGPRQRGLIFLAGAMTMFGGLSVIYLLDDVIGARQASALDRFIHSVALSSGYGDAIALGCLAAAAIVIIVQEAFLDSARAHTQRILSIAASETRLNGIIQAAQEAIVTVDHDGRIELVNVAVEAMLGLPRAELLGRVLSEFVVDPGAVAG